MNTDTEKNACLSSVIQTVQNCAPRKELIDSKTKGESSTTETTRNSWGRVTTKHTKDTKKKPEELINADSNCAQTTPGFAFIRVHSRLFSFVFFVFFVDN
jgi:hypothetical protein